MVDHTTIRLKGAHASVLDVGFSNSSSMQSEFVAGLIEIRRIEPGFRFVSCLTGCCVRALIWRVGAIGVSSGVGAGKQAQESKQSESLHFRTLASA